MSEAQSPVEEFVEGSRREHELIFYSLSTCVMCRKARSYLTERGFAYRIIYVDHLAIEEKNALKERLSRQHAIRVTFPALSVDGTRLILGFFQSSWDEALGERADG